MLRLGTICCVHGRLAYVSHTGGKRLRRPNRLEHFVVHVFNSVACALFGHDRTLEQIPETWDDDGMFSCVACCKRLRPTARSS